MEFELGSLSVRVSSFSSPFHMLFYRKGQFDELYDFLKKNRITCGYLSLVVGKWTKKECVALCEILKPLSIRVDSRKSNRYEALLQYKQLVQLSFSFVTYFLLGTCSSRY